LPQLAGYLRSWSATAQYLKEHGHDPVAAVEQELQAEWGDPMQARTIRWPFRVIAGRLE
jgi:hypothetical protein